MPPYTDDTKNPERKIIIAGTIIDIFQIFFILLAELRSANVVIFQLAISQFPDIGYKVWARSPE
jgi:hypothetical protein